MHKRLLLFTLLIMLFTCHAYAQDNGASFIDVPQEVSPGKAVRITYELSQSGSVDMLVQTAEGATVAAIMQEYEASAGQSAIIWDGMYWGEPVPSGEYVLSLSIHGAENSVTVPIKIGGIGPKLEGITLSSDQLTSTEQLTITVNANMAGTLSLMLEDEGEETLLFEQTAQTGENVIQWNGMMEGQAIADGTHTIGLLLTNQGGDTSNIEYFKITASGVIAKAQILPDTQQVTTLPATSYTTGWDRSFTPSYGSPYTSDIASSYWNTPMDITDEEAVWNMLMAPMTVVKGHQKDQVYLYSQPNADSEAVGEVTCDSQGVNVIETFDDGWSLVETYSSSFSASKVRAWHKLVQGYIQTNKLTQAAPGNKQYAMVVDKLTQRLYLFKDGKLFTTLAVSTGLVNSTQPFNETRSGEYFLVSPVGEFASGNMDCSYGLRFNDGDILHEVPHIKASDGTKNYGYTEPKLGQKASHGCIRIQRKVNGDGYNMNWLWNTLYKSIAKNYVKLVVWEDWPGRQIPIPSDDSPVYYNPNGGSNYHSTATCKGVKDKFLPLSSFTYGEQETNEKYKKLTPCAYCFPTLKKSQLEAFNATYLVAE